MDNTKALVEYTVPAEYGVYIVKFKNGYSVEVEAAGAPMAVSKACDALGGVPIYQADTAFWLRDLTDAEADNAVEVLVIRSHKDHVAAIKSLCEQSRLSPSSRSYMDNLAKNAAEQGITLDDLEFAMGELTQADIDAIQVNAEEAGQAHQSAAASYFATNPAAQLVEREAAPAHMLAWPF